MIASLVLIAFSVDITNKNKIEAIEPGFYRVSSLLMLLFCVRRVFTLLCILYMQDAITSFW